MSDITEALSQVKIQPMDITGVVTLILMIAVGLLIIKLLQKVFRRLLSNTKLDTRIQKYVLSGLNLILYILLIIAVMERLGLNASSLVALLSVAALGLTLAAEDILGNMAGGLVILTSHPFAIGDYIEADGAAGTVEEIALNHTKIVTPDGLTTLIPNKTLAGAKVINYTALGRRRVAWKVTASYDAPTEAVKAACRTAMERTPHLLADPAPAVYLSGYGSSSIEYSVYCWAPTEHYWEAYYQLAEHLRAAFQENRVEMTYDHLNVHIVESGK